MIYTPKDFTKEPLDKAIICTFNSFFKVDATTVALRAKKTVFLYDCATL